MFKVLKNSKKSKARLGKLTTKNGTIDTPFFMPIATKGAVKALTASELAKLNSQIILSNTYHQLLRPGLPVLKKFGGLGGFMDWPGPILTDSGGFQVFSLAKIRKILPGGVKFRSHIDGKELFLTPKKVLQIQSTINSDIRMILDVCPAYPCARQEAEKACKLTADWAQKSKDEILSDKKKSAKNLFFAIVQGSVYKDLRLKSATDLVNLNFDGYAIGGLAVGESPDDMYKVVKYTAPALPENKPRYLMGAGYPEQIVKVVKMGVDMFDCVIPSREARHGRLYTWKSGSKNSVNLSGKNFYKTININNARFKKDKSAINEYSKIPELQKYSKAYLSHLFKTKEPLALRLATLNNVEFYLGLMDKIRQAIKKDKF